MMGEMEISLKEIAILIIFIVFILPGLLSVISLSLKAPTSEPKEITEEGAKIIAEQAVPWWIGIIEFFSKLPSALAAFLILGFIFFLKWIGDI